MIKRAISKSHYIEELASAIKVAKPYFVDCKAKLKGENSDINDFPKSPGIYLILRKVKIMPIDYTTKGLNTKTPIILYVGKTTSKRSIRERLRDHFGGNKLNFQGSQFRKFLMQVCQDTETVRRILWSENTLIASVSVDDSDEVIDYVENLAIRAFQPRFNIKDR